MSDELQRGRELTCQVCQQDHHKVIDNKREYIPVMLLWVRVKVRERGGGGEGLQYYPLNSLYTLMKLPELRM